MDDDARLKTVAVVDDTPEHVLDRAHVEAASGRSERDSGGGIAQLTDAEKDRLGPFTEPNTYGKAAAVKGVMLDAGVDDWTSHYDPTLTVDEHRDLAERAAREGGGRRLDQEDSADDRLGRAEEALGEECDHARGHCEHGDPDACEFLQEACGYDEDEVASILDDSADQEAPEQRELVTVGGGEEFPEMEVTPAEAGALRKSWQGYKGALAELRDALEVVQEEVVNGRQAFRAINAVRTQNGQDELHPNDLHDLLESLEALPGSIPEVRTLSHFVDDGDDGGRFANVSQQETLGTDADAEEAAEEAQLTLAGEDAADSVGALPSTWTAAGRGTEGPTTWTAGPYRVEVRRDGETVDVTLRGPENKETVASGLREESQAVEIAREFTERLAPSEVSFHSDDSAVPTAAAEAKRAAPDAEGGLSEYA